MHNMYNLLLVLVNNKSLIEICDQITLELGFFDLLPVTTYIILKSAWWFMEIL